MCDTDPLHRSGGRAGGCAPVQVRAGGCAPEALQCEVTLDGGGNSRFFDLSSIRGDLIFQNLHFTNVRLNSARRPRRPNSFDCGAAPAIGRPGGRGASQLALLSTTASVVHHCCCGSLRSPSTAAHASTVKKEDYT
jgi:hypothetical protein